MKMQGFKTINLLIILFLLLQVLMAAFRFDSFGGWCTNALLTVEEAENSDQQSGYYSFKFFSFGFPLTALTVSREGCFESRTTTYEWSPVGIVVDSLLLVVITFPLWKVDGKGKEI